MIYEKRVNHVFELKEMDADITATNDIIYNEDVHGARKAMTCGAGAALVIAGLMAKATRNYEYWVYPSWLPDIIEKLRSLGADIGYLLNTAVEAEAARKRNLTRCA